MRCVGPLVQRGREVAAGEVSVRISRGEKAELKQLEYRGKHVHSIWLRCEMREVIVNVIYEISSNSNLIVTWRGLYHQ